MRRTTLRRPAPARPAQTPVISAGRIFADRDSARGGFAQRRKRGLVSGAQGIRRPAAPFANDVSIRVEQNAIRLRPAAVKSQGVAHGTSLLKPSSTATLGCVVL